jgi:hypothetical protein
MYGVSVRFYAPRLLPRCVFRSPLLSKGDYLLTRLTRHSFERPPLTMDENVLRAPRRTAASLSPEKLERIPYPPNFLPGERDVNSPYGTIRVYEWGPEDGRKVLFIHGLSTPAPALRIVADTLAQRGCRVMVLGRFFSDLLTYHMLPTRFYPNVEIIYLHLIQIFGVEDIQMPHQTSSTTLASTLRKFCLPFRPLRFRGQASLRVASLWLATLWVGV